MLLYILCVAADFPTCSNIFVVSDLPNDMSPDLAESSPCQGCMPHLPSAGLGEQSQPAIKE